MSCLSRCLIALIVAMVPVWASAQHNAQGSDAVVYSAPEDEDMDRAVKGARETLGNVLERAATGGLPMEALQLKVAIPKEGGGHENIWVEGIVQIDATTFEALLANDPRALPDRKRGDRHRFRRGEITDWLFVANGRMHGAYTLRVMLPLLPPAQAAEFRAILAPLP
ncbi:MAG: DUF2314 domain-containing protein [Pseudomonadota bacterium]